LDSTPRSPPPFFFPEGPTFSPPSSSVSVHIESFFRMAQTTPPRPCTANFKDRSLAPSLLPRFRRRSLGTHPFVVFLSGSRGFYPTGEWPRFRVFVPFLPRPSSRTPPAYTPFFLRMSGCTPSAVPSPTPPPLRTVLRRRFIACLPSLSPLGLARVPFPFS